MRGVQHAPSSRCRAFHQRLRRKRRQCVPEQIAGIPLVHVVDAIIVLVILEMVALIAFRRRTLRGMPGNEVVSFLGAGAGLMIALRVLLSDGALPLFAAAMLFSLAMHVWHVKQRWL